MATLTEQDTGRTFHLAAHTVVGRGPASTLRVRAPSVSGVHAQFTWTAEGWVLRDLGSRNGTTVDGEPASDLPLQAGAVIRFGTVAWELTDASPPSAVARSPLGEVAAVDGMLLLPSADDPEVVVVEDPDEGWVAETDAGRGRIESGGTVQAGGATWQVHLPTTLGSTVAPSGLAPELQEIGIRFEVSSDEEFVRTVLSGPRGWTTELEPRSYHYMLVTLARARLDSEGSAAERGWVHRDELARMLRVSPRTLTVHLCRARQQVAEAGVLGASGLVEQRPSTRELRLGVGTVEVGPLS